MSFGQSISTCLHKYATFDGRASRSEFWWFYLFYTLIGLVLALPGSLLMVAGMSVDTTPGQESMTLNGAFWAGLFLILVAALVQLAIIIPMLAVGCRRLHDYNQSGWLQLLLLVPCASIVLIVFWALEGTPGPNGYGPPPARLLAS